VLVLLAALLVAGALLPWGLRIACAFGAIGVLVLMIALRLRARAVQTQKRRVVDVYAAVARIRADRKARYERGRPRRRDS